MHGTDIGKLLLVALLAGGLMGMAGAAETDGKVVVIGLDGASHAFMQDCLSRHDMPNITGLAGDGGFERMDATLPPLTPSVMSSFLTGTGPGDHGIYGFEKRSVLDYTTSSVNARYLDRILPQAVNGSSVMINVPMTYPAPEIDGVVVSGFPGSTSGNYVFPPTLKQDLADRNYTVTTAGTFDDQDDLEREVFDAFATRRTLALDYMDRFDWRFFMVMFTGDARLLHFDAPDGCDGAIADYYAELDRFVGEVRDRVDDDTTVVLMSNHGFEPLRKKMYMYTFLKDRGYLAPRTVPYYRHYLEDVAGRILASLGLKSGGEVSGRASFSSAYMEEVDWEHTQAYTGAFYNGQVFLNVEGREPNGQVAPDDYHDVRADIIADLEALEDPETGDPVVTAVHTKEELYGVSDPAATNAVPDIVIETPGYNHVARFGFGRTFLDDPVEASAPVKEGFVMADRPITGTNMSIIDLSTSVAALLGTDFGIGRDIFN